MLKRNITYKNFDDEEVTETFYFNISKTELIDLEVEYKEGIKSRLTRIIDSKNARDLWNQFKEIVQLAYGEKSEDGKHFMKTDHVKELFKNSAAYEALLIELTSNEDAAADFIKGILPAEMSEKVDQDKPELTRVASSPPSE